MTKDELFDLARSLQDDLITERLAREAAEQRAIAAEARLAAVKKYVHKAYCGGLPLTLSSGEEWMAWADALRRCIDSATDDSRPPLAVDVGSAACYDDNGWRWAIDLETYAEDKIQALPEKFYVVLLRKD